MSDEQRKGRVLFDCETASAAPYALADELRAADSGMASPWFERGKTPRKGRLFDLIWLVYSIFFILEPIQRNTRSVWIGFGIAYACFLGLYFLLIASTSRHWQLTAMLGLGALALIYLPFNAGACGMFIYVAAFAPFVTESIGLGAAVIVAASVAMTAEGALLHINPWNWGVCAFFALAAGAGNMVAAQRMRAGRKLGLAYEEIAHLSRVAERERIARDLHDVLGHTLSVVVLKSELAGKLMERNPARARREIGEVEAIARKALTEVREAIRGYRAEGLTAELMRAQKTLDAAGVALELNDKPPQLPPAEETVLSLIVREAVTNIVRHAQASRCRMAFEARGEGTALVVEDDGRGGIREEGNGLRGMRERAESLGGRLLVVSGNDAPGPDGMKTGTPDQETPVRGTRLVVEIPAKAGLAAEA